MDSNGSKINLITCMSYFYIHSYYIFNSRTNLIKYIMLTFAQTILHFIIDKLNMAISILLLLRLQASMCSFIIFTLKSFVCKLYTVPFFNNEK